MDISTDGNLIVSNVSLEMDPYLGIKMTDPIGDPVDSETARKIGVSPVNSI